jgi:hypothetical protein
MIFDDIRKRCRNIAQVLAMHTTFFTGMNWPIEYAMSAYQEEVFVSRPDKLAAQSDCVYIIASRLHYMYGARNEALHVLARARCTSWSIACSRTRHMHIYLP